MPMVDDITWAGLDPDAGRFTPRQRSRAALAVGAAALVAVLAGVVWWSGVLVPRVRLEQVTGDSPVNVIAASRTFTYRVMLANPAPGAVTIRSVGRSGPGLKLLSVLGADSPLAGSTSEEIKLTYRVTDCSLVPQQAWPVPVRIQTWDGEQVRMLAVPPVDPFWLDDAPPVDSSEVTDGLNPTEGLDVSDDPDSGDQQWQAVLSEQVCASHR